MIQIIKYLKRVNKHRLLKLHQKVEKDKTTKYRTRLKELEKQPLNTVPIIASRNLPL